jgi:hypothetical protein
LLKYYRPPVNGIGDWTKQDEIESGEYLFKPTTELKDCILNAGEFLALEFPPKNKILGFLSESTIWMISGWRGAGKTWFGLSFAISITKGDSFGPWEAGSIVPTCYFDGELNPADIQQRVRLLSPQISNYLDFYCDHVAHNKGYPKADLSSETWREHMGNYLLDTKIKLWFLDNISSVSGSIVENSAEAWGDVNNWLLKLRHSGVSTVLIHHVGKNKQQRGTSRREDNLDGSIVLLEPPGYTQNMGACFTLKFEKTRLAPEDLKLIQDYEFKLVPNDTGHLIWAYDLCQNTNKNRVRRMLENGFKSREIADELGLSYQYVNRIKREKK